MVVNTIISLQLFSLSFCTDNDGYADIITATSDPNSFQYLLNNKDGTFSSPFSVDAAIDSISDFAFGDFDRDGYQDIAVTINCPYGTLETLPDTGYLRCSSSGNAVLVYRNLFNGGTGFAAPYTVYQSSITESLPNGINHNPDTDPAEPTISYLNGRSVASASEVEAVDLTNDGYLDLVVAFKGADTTKHLVWFTNNLDGTFSDFNLVGTSFWQNSGEGASHVAALDVNQDGWMDLVSSYRIPSTVSLWLNQGDGTFNSDPTDLSRGCEDMCFDSFGRTFYMDDVEVADIGAVPFL